MRSYAESDHGAERRIIVVEIDNETRKAWEEGGKTVGQQLPVLINVVRELANTVILDVELADTISDSAKNDLVDALKKGHARVVAPLRLRPGDGADGWEAERDWIDSRNLGASGQSFMRAAALLTPDDYDGVVRHLTMGACVSFPAEATSSETIRWVRVSSLAEAAVHPQEQTSCNPNDAEEERPVILYQYEKQNAGAIRTVPASKLIDKNAKSIASDSDLFQMKDAFVLIGQTGGEAWTDLHRTPLGLKPGVLVTANAIFTMQKQKGDRQQDSTLLYDFGAIVVLAALYALMLAAIRRVFPESVRLIPELIGLTVYFVVATFAVGKFWTYIGANALVDGVAFGTFVPVLAVGLEALIEAGHMLIKSIRSGFEWLFGNELKILALAIAALVAMQGSGHAEDRVGTVTLRDAGADVAIRRSGQLVKPTGEAVMDLLPNDALVVGPKTEVWVERKGYPSQFVRGPTELAVDPAPRDGVLASWTSFWRRPRLRHSEGGDSTVPGASIVPRGDHHAAVGDPSAIIAAGGDIARALPVAGPLRLPSAFPDAGYLATDLSGLALAWSGGTPPYDVVTEDEDGATIAEFHSDATFLWTPDWRTPQAPARLRISDANDRALHIEIRPTSPRPGNPGADPLADAIDLFEADPALRFEALRRIARLAGHDPTAAQAVLAIRLAE
jgi:CHASE2 domain-containing sensor protein